MSKVLIVTVGGSPQPIITSVKVLKPKRVIFICTDGNKGSRSQVVGKGKPCVIRRGPEIIKELPNLPAVLKLDSFNQDTDMALIQDPDDASECYSLACNTIKNLMKTNDIIMADYTGGTKTMSLSLGMAAIDYNIPLYLTTSTMRTNLIGVYGGEYTELVSTSLINIERKIEQFLPVHLKNYQYPAAFERLNELLTSVQVPKESKKKIRCLLDFCVAFDSWDKFKHIEAWQLLEIYLKDPDIRLSGLFLKRVMESRGRIDALFTPPGRISAHGYEIVEDLVLNAERRASQARYDDAVSRLYRSLELMVQIRLKSKHGILTGCVNLEDIPEQLREKFSRFSSDENTVKLGLLQSYELLSSLPEDPLGKLFLKNADKIQGVLQIRNNSILAHGFTTVNESDYIIFSSIVINFINRGIKELTLSGPQEEPVQFPVSPGLAY